MGEPASTSEPVFASSSSKDTGAVIVRVCAARSIAGSTQPVGLLVTERFWRLTALKPTFTVWPADRNTAGESNERVPDSLSLLHEAKNAMAATAQTSPANLFI